MLTADGDPVHPADGASGKALSGKGKRAGGMGTEPDGQTCGGDPAGNDDGKTAPKGVRRRANI